MFLVAFTLYESQSNYPIKTVSIPTGRITFLVLTLDSDFMRVQLSDKNKGSWNSCV